MLLSRATLLLGRVTFLLVKAMSLVDIDHEEVGGECIDEGLDEILDVVSELLIGDLWFSSCRVANLLVELVTVALVPKIVTPDGWIR